MNKRLTPADILHIRRSIVALVIRTEKQLKMPWVTAQRLGDINMERNK